LLFSEDEASLNQGIYTEFVLIRAYS